MSNDKVPESPLERMTNNLQPINRRSVLVGFVMTAAITLFVCLANPFNIMLFLFAPVMAVLFPIAGAMVAVAYKGCSFHESVGSKQAGCGLGIALFLWAFGAYLWLFAVV